MDKIKELVRSDKDAEEWLETIFDVWGITIYETQIEYKGYRVDIDKFRKVKE